MKVLNNKKFAFHTLGCKVNLYETAEMEENLKKAGAVQVPFEGREEADIYIINTCTVTNMADRKSRQMLHRARKNHPEAILVAIGCYIETEKPEKLLSEDVDLFLGNWDKHQIAKRLAEYLESGNQPERKSILTVSEYPEEFLSEPNERIRADLKVQDGCDSYCSYCAIPLARGHIRSKRIEDAVSEATKLSENGVKEIVISGIHLSSYGMDWKDENVRLIDLLKALNAIPKITRIRLGSLEPRIITEEFAKEIAGLNKICPHFHLSLQSGCDKTLKAMNRHYTAEEYRASVERLRKVYERPAITTDVIAGFPGETEEDFRESYRFIESIRFAELHVFPYSERKNTKAALLPMKLTAAVKEERALKLIALGNEMTENYRKEVRGIRDFVLIEKIDSRAYGYTTRYVPQEIENRNYRVNDEISFPTED